MNFKKLISVMALTASLFAANTAFAAYERFGVMFSNYTGSWGAQAKTIAYSMTNSDQIDGPAARQLLANESQEVGVWRDVDDTTSGMVANIEVTDPANGEVIFKGQVQYDTIDGRIILFIAKSSENYTIIPDIRQRTDKYQADINIIVYDKFPSGKMPALSLMKNHFSKK